MEDELLGEGTGAGAAGGLAPGGVFSTAVYLANCNGLNAAVKVFSFKAGSFEVESPSFSSSGSSSSRRGVGARAGCGFQKHLGGAGAAKNSAMHKEEEEIERMFAGAEASGGDNNGGRHGALAREVAALKRLRNPRVVTIYGAVGCGAAGGGRPADDGGAPTVGPLLLAMELLPGGSLRQRLQRSVSGASSPRRGGLLPLGWKAMRGIVKDVCAGMAFLHGEAFVHGGLSSTNVLLDAKGRAKVITDTTRAFVCVCVCVCVCCVSCVGTRPNDQS